MKPETFDLGARGRLGEAFEWNLGYYRTELKDDIYTVTYFGNQNFFDSIGKNPPPGHRNGTKRGFRQNAIWPKLCIDRRQV